MITLTEAKVQEEWAVTLPECHGESEGFLRAVEGHLERRRPPEVTWKRDSMAPSTMKGLTGKRRDGLVVSSAGFREHLVCVMARDYGATLNIAWYLSGSTRAVILAFLARIPVVSRLLSLIGLLRDLDVFDRQDLRAWVTVVHGAVRHAVEDIKAKHNLEVTIDWKSKGTFGVS
jgi:hypothetical protein